MNVKVECKEVDDVDDNVNDEVVDEKLTVYVVDDGLEVDVDVTAKVAVIVNVDVEVNVVGVVNVYADITLQSVVDDDVENDVSNEVDKDVVRDDDNEAGSDGDVDEAANYIGHAVVDLVEVEEVLDDVVAANVSVVDDVLDDDVVEVGVINVLDDVVVVVNPINATAVDVVEYDDDAYDDGFTIEIVDELRIDNENNEDDVDVVVDV